jgi:hypothetical protein
MTTRRGSNAWYRQQNEARLLQLGMGFEDTRALQRLARSLHSAAERECNEPMTEAQTARHEKRVARMEEAAAAIAARHGFNVYVQGDPRGWPLYLWTQADLDEYNNRGADFGMKSAYKIDSVYSSIGIGVCPL